MKPNPSSPAANPGPFPFPKSPDSGRSPAGKGEERPATTPEEPRTESAAESIGRAITAPMRDAAESEERRNTGER